MLMWRALSISSYLGLAAVFGLVARLLALGNLVRHLLEERVDPVEGQEEGHGQHIEQVVHRGRGEPAAQVLLAAGSLTTSTRTRSDLPSGWMLIQTRRARRRRWEEEVEEA